MNNGAATVNEYLAQLPEDRREALEAVRQTILARIPDGYEEVMQYGMIAYVVPHSRFPAGYHCDPRQALTYAGLANHKQYASLYLMAVYGNEESARKLREAFAQAGKKLDMGKSCIRFKRADDLPLEVIGDTIASLSVDDYLRAYEALIPASKRKAK